jgi:hypothetical protein
MAWHRQTYRRREPGGRSWLSAARPGTAAIASPVGTRVASTSRRAKSLVGGMVLMSLAVVSMVVTGLSPAFAVDPGRQELPIVAGTELAFPTGNCTAGLVLVADGVLWNVTQYQRAVRYVLTAGHCGEVNDAVGLNTASSGRKQVGKVIWKSGVSDLELVRIEPDSQRGETCSVTSTGPFCTITVNYTPRAFGRVITTAGSQLSVTGVSAPSDTEIFCTSGKTTNFMCTWHTYTLDPPIRGADAGVVYAETTASNTDAGDSGGPVVSRSGGVNYGIILGGGNPDGREPTVMPYTPISQFSSEQSGYSLAPA